MSDNAQEHVESLDCPELMKAHEDSLECESSDNKRKLDGTENISSDSVPKKKPNVEESKDTPFDRLPEETMLKIFHYLSHNELGNIARVSKKWHEFTKCIQLWKKVHVQFRWKLGSQNKVTAIFYESLPTCVQYLRIDFQLFTWEEPLEFQEFCVKLGEKCLSLKVLVLHDAEFSVSLQSAIDLCKQHLQNLEVLSFHRCIFTNHSVTGEFNNLSKIKILDLFGNFCSESAGKLSLSNIFSLEKLSIVFTGVNDSWFTNDPSSLCNLEVLQLSGAMNIGSRTFSILKKHAFKLKELYMCGTRLSNSDFNFSNTVFPQLKTICLRWCKNVTHEGIVSLIDSCKSLQNIYVNEAVIGVLRFVITNKYKLQIVKTINTCEHYEKNLYEQYIKF